MRLSFGLDLQQKQIQKLAPRMIQSMEILQLPLMALQEKIDQALSENPVLEITADVDESTAESDAEILEGREKADGEKELVVKDESNNADDFERLLQMDQDLPDTYEESHRKSTGQREEDADRQHDAIANLQQRPESLNDFLVAQLDEWELEPEMEEMCKRIISTLDPRDGGYLKVQLRDLLPPDATPAQHDLARRSLEVVHQLEPPGIGARDLKECLLLQIHAGMPCYEAMRRIINHHLEDLRENRLPLIVKATGMTIDQVKTTWEEIKKLNPKPAAAFAETFVPMVTPDVSVERGEDGEYKVTLLDDRTPTLHISDYYRQRLMSETASAEEKEFIRRKINAAQWLIESIEQRRSTVTKVAQEIVNHQKRFLDEGPEFIEPLKMQQIAERVGVHVTTVSRAVDEKYIQTPRGIMPLKRFFVGGTKSEGGEEVAWDIVRIKLTEIVEKEDKKHPLSDDEIVKEFEKQGLSVARRTITKYRKNMDIPSSRERRDWNGK
jgi:RNA polymerase sigma-54 factor